MVRPVEKRRLTRPATRVIGLTLAALFATAPLFAEDRLLFDFDTGRLADAWSVVGVGQASLEATPAGAPDGDNSPRGQAAQLECRQTAAFFTRAGLVPADWSDFSNLVAWVYRDEAEANARSRTVLEIQLVEPDGKARFARRIDLDRFGWQKLELPLDGFRWGEGRVPQWQKIDRLGFVLRGGGRVAVDSISLREGPPRSALLMLDEVSAIAFPDAPADGPKRFASDRVELLGDAPRLDAEILASHLAKVAAAVFEDLPFLERRAGSGRLLIFATRESYRAFPARLAKTLGAAGPVPKSQGFTLHGLATSFWDDKLGTLRPVYTHEFVHSLASNCGLLQNNGEWLQEGLASRYQLRFHPQANVGAIVKNGLTIESSRLPLDRLCQGKPIPMDRYWQAMTLVDMLVTDAKYREKFPALFEAFAAAGSTDLAPHLAPILGKTWDQLTTDWQAWCRERYP